MKKYDVIVVGGGFSGVMAACAAARENLSVLLVEKSGSLGGAAVLNFVLPFMGFELKRPGASVPLNRGLFAEFLRRLDAYAETDGGEKVVKKEGLVTYNEEFLKLVLDDMTDAYGADVLFHATLTGAETKNGTVENITVAGMFGTETLSADYFIDATGNADLAFSAGVNCRVGRESDGKCQPMTLCFRMGNVDVDAFYENDYLNVNKLWKEKLKNGELINPREDILSFRHTTPDVLHLNSTRVLKSPLSAAEKSSAEKEGRRQMLELFRFLRMNAPSCRNATLLSSASEIGVRESRMIDGLYNFTADDIISCRKFPDAIAAGNYDIDIHSPDGSGTSHYWIPDGEYYTVPYRSLIPRGFNNLMAVGRCISSTHEAQASYRIMPIVACIGEGGATALAVAAKTGSALSQLDVKRMREALDKYDLIEGYPQAAEKNGNMQ